MTTLTRSQTVNALTGITYIKHPHDKPICIKLGKTFAITGADQYFVIQSNNVTIKGSRKREVLVSYVGGLYIGLVQNGTFTTRAYDNLTVKNICISTAIGQSQVVLDPDGGWIGQTRFGTNAQNVVVKCCVNNGEISENGGGIVGSFSSCSIIKCVNNGLISQTGSGGIVGANSSGTNVIKCKNTETARILGNGAGGIFGYNPVNCSAKQCNNKADILSTNTGGIFGLCTSVAYNNAIECKNSGKISGSGSSGGIFSAGLYSSAYKCYNTGDIINNNGGIFGTRTNYCVVLACYNIGNITNGAGIIGSGKSNTIRNCYNYGSLGNGYGIINDTGNNANLIDHCYVASLAISGQNPIHPSTITSTIVTKTSDVSEASGKWKDCYADKYLLGTDGTIWIKRHNKPYKLNMC